MHATAVLLDGAEGAQLARLQLSEPGENDVLVDVSHSGISTGTEKLFWSGQMPSFPGMGYPLVPGYEAVGEVIEAGSAADFRPGDTVFVPGSACYEGAYGLFGAASKSIVVSADRAVPIDRALKRNGVLLALAATARHALAGYERELPDLIVGHGVLGRLLARLTIAAGGAAPRVWETDPLRMSGATGYDVVSPEDDACRDYGCIYDVSGNGAITGDLISRLKKGGELVLAGFYPAPVSFPFAPAFQRETRIRVSAEWTPQDMIATRSLIESGLLDLDGLITHTSSAERASEAYPKAFTDPSCLKMILDWKDVA